MKSAPEYHSQDVPYMPLLLSRRGLFKETGKALMKVAAAPALAAVAERLSSDHLRIAKAQELPPGEVKDMTLWFLQEAGRKQLTIEDTGYRISNAYMSPQDGLWEMALQGIIWQRNPKLGMVPKNSLDEIPDELDPELERYYQIPPRRFYDGDTGNTDEDFKRRATVFELSPRILARAQDIRRRYEIGVPTALQRNYGPFSVARFQRLALQDFGERIERILTGDVAKNVGRTVPAPDGRTITLPGEKIIPDEALLDQPDLSSLIVSREPSPQPISPDVLKQPFPDSIDLGAGSAFLNLDPKYGMAPSPNPAGRPSGLTPDQYRLMSVEYMQRMFEKYSDGSMLKLSLGRNRLESPDAQATDFGTFVYFASINGPHTEVHYMFTNAFDRLPIHEKRRLSVSVNSTIAMFLRVEHYIKANLLSRDYYENYVLTRRSPFSLMGLPEPVPGILRDMTLIGAPEKLYFRSVEDR